MDCNTIIFPSRASITLPEGMNMQTADGSLYHFSIGKEELHLSYLEHQGSLQSALDIAKKRISILPSEEPFFSRSPSEVEFDGSSMEVYGKNGQGQYRQLFGRSQGLYSWVLSISGEEGVLERRSSQIMALFQSLKPPEQRKIDLSSMRMASMGPKRAELESFVKEAMEKAQVPGLSLAIIERGAIVYSQGFGVTALSEKGKEVLPSTRFMIGSISKSMTTFLIAKLEEEGFLQWTDRAVELDPQFRLGDELLSNKLTLEELTCAATGIPRHDIPMMMNHAGKQAANLFADLLHLKPSSSANEVFQYNNQLVAASGFIAAKRVQQHPFAGLPADLSVDSAFAQLLKSRLFTPMEMTRSTVEFEEVVDGEDFALPHSRTSDGTTVPIELSHERFATHVAPAGAIWSTASDMANYGLTELNRGFFQSKRILSEERLLYRRQGKLPLDHESKYALGWLVGKKKGLDVVEHSGGTMGFSSDLVLFPEMQSGIVLLTNSSGGLILQPIVEQILSLWFQVDLRAKEQLKADCAAWESYLDFNRRHTFDPSQELIQRALGGHFHPELGYFVIGEGEEGQLYLDKDGIRYRLAGYREEGKEEKLMIVEAPFIGYLLEPMFEEGVTFKIQRGQECYECRAQ